MKKGLKTGSKAVKIFTVGIIGILLFGSFGLDPGSSAETETFELNPAEGLFAGGSGTEADPYLITHVDHLQRMRGNMFAHYRLADDVYAAETARWNEGKGFIPIGEEDNPFLGQLDGDGYEIKNLYINRPDESFVGLFGAIGEGGGLSDLTLRHARIKGENLVGGFAGQSMEGFVKNSETTGSVVGNGRVGGLIGENHGDIIDSSSSANIHGNNRVGGVIGHNEKGDIDRTFATGDVTGRARVGGFIGSTRSFESNISDSFASGDVEGNESVGGFIGKISGLHYAPEPPIRPFPPVLTINACYSVGRVTGDEDSTGGFIGYISGRSEDEVKNSFWDVKTSGLYESERGTPKTTEEMQSISTYEWADWDIATSDEWDGETWEIDEGNDYPRLREPKEDSILDYLWLIAIIAFVAVLVVMVRKREKKGDDTDKPTLRRKGDDEEI